MKNTILIIALLFGILPLYGQIEQEVRKRDGEKEVHEIEKIDSIRFDVEGSEMEIRMKEGGVEVYKLGDILEVGFAGKGSGYINVLDCEGALVWGEAIEGVEATGVSIEVKYIGGNGGPYGMQEIPSTGVLGLTATLSGGTFNVGPGILTLEISGVAQSSGVAVFLLDLGGQSCEIELEVLEGGEIDVLICDSAEVSGQIVEGVEVNGVMVTIDYSGGDGGYYGSQEIASTGVMGLTASLPAGQFNLGPGNVDLEISGTAFASGVAVFLLELGGQSCELEIEVIKGGEVDVLICSSVEVEGEVVEGEEVNGVTVSIDYSGGNGGPYGMQEISSTGVLGLTALLPAGQLNVGPGNLILEISGVAQSSGFAVFDFEFGGQSCDLLVAVKGGEVTDLDCENALVEGTVVEGEELNGVTVSIGYDGGNGGTYGSQSISSTGVLGLTAFLPAGQFNVGAGSVVLEISGTPQGSGIALFGLELGGQSCVIEVLVGAGCGPDNPTEVVDVLNPETGNIWMDRNLGASRVAMSSTDGSSYGDLYQWGRLSDGHQCRNSATTTTLSSSDEPGHGEFIVVSASPFDWRSPQNDNLWQGLNGVNNPCPSGYRLPTVPELTAERMSWSSNDAAGAFGSPLKLPVAGFRLSSNGLLSGVGIIGGYWSSTVVGANARILYISGSSSSILADLRAVGYSVRCLKEFLEGEVSNLECEGATVSGEIVEGVEASGLTVTVGYTGGNGGSYESQSIASTGVLGLTASLAAGQFNVGVGSVVLTIAGTAQSSGVAVFSLELGGQSCVIEVEVEEMDLEGEIEELDCAGATVSGEIVEGVEVIGLMVTVGYTGGNGGFYESQSIASTGVLGLTAFLPSGQFNVGVGSVVLTITGTAQSSGVAVFSLELGGQSCVIEVEVEEMDLEGEIQELDCEGSVVNGEVFEGVDVSGLTATVGYTGGNGGFYESQSIASTGVLGLTAFLPAGQFNVGEGSVVLTITGTAQSSGVAIFFVELGGQSCVIEIVVISSEQFVLICDSALMTGELVEGVEASGVNVEVWYGGGDGGAYEAQSIASTGVLGLTANLAAGEFNVGEGSVVLTIMGTAESTGIAVFSLELGGELCVVELEVMELIGEIGELNCLGTLVSGEVVAGVEVSGLTATVNYGGGNGGPYESQEILSTGVLGLTASLPAGEFNIGDGSVVLTISGTAQSSGMAVFILELGGESCEIELQVMGGEVSSLDCFGAEVTGEVNEGQVVTGVSIEIGYSGGNGGIYGSQSVASMGVLGLTASLPAGQFNIGDGSVVLTISGTAQSSGVAVFILELGGQSCAIEVNVIETEDFILICDSALMTGEIVAGVVVSGVNIEVWYTGGNGGPYGSQSIASTGVLGLTAFLAAGQFNVGPGSVVLTITGTAQSSGVASFVLELGGESCEIEVEVMGGEVSNLDCEGAMVSGEVVEGVEVSGVSIEVGYTGGNGGPYDAQEVSSTGVLGLTASLPAGEFNVGPGSVVLTIAGTAESSGVAVFVLELGGQSCEIEVEVMGGEVSNLECDNSTVSGEVVEGVEVSGVSIEVGYTGGNGGPYDAQEVSSTGVLGLTASLSAGEFNVGPGSVVLTITGTAESSGVAVFVLELGGESCEIEVEVMGGEVSNLECDNATVSGEVVEGVEVSGVSIEVGYTGGNGGPYGSQSIASTGVLGLTASLSAGQFNVGPGSVVLTITGTAESSGVASFILELGGESCELEVEVMGGEVSNLECDNATLSGEVVEGVEVSGVSIEVGYTGGNGGAYAAQEISSTGVLGLTASLSAGDFNVGPGSVVLTITGTAQSSGVASFILELGGESCELGVEVMDGEETSYPPGTVHCDPDNPTEVVDVLNPSTGKTWMDRNLGASQVAQAFDDPLSYGDLYQWGRLADGHQCRTSPTTTQLSSSDVPGHGDFILAPNSPRDWRSPQNGNLWQGVNGVNNPCPSGYRVPTESELNTERLSWSSDNRAGAFASPLKLPSAGFRSNSNGSLLDVGTFGGYWSSTVSSTLSRLLYFSSSSATMTTSFRARGFSVRCLKD